MRRLGSMDRFDQLFAIHHDQSLHGDAKLLGHVEERLAGKFSQRIAILG